MRWRGDDPPQGRNHPRLSQAKWPHPVALPAEKVRGVKNGEVILCRGAAMGAMGAQRCTVHPKRSKRP
jgi:hypothetical protein